MTRTAEVAVVGGGVIGGAVAFHAAKRGLRTLLVDLPRRGRATSASAGGLWPLGESLGLGCGVIFHRALLARDPDAAPGAGPETLPPAFLEFALRSNGMFPALAEELRERSGMDVELERSSLLFLFLDEGDESFGRGLLRAHPGIRESMDLLGPEEVARAEPAVTRDLHGALRFRGDDQVNPYRLADALRSSAVRLGADLLAHTPVTGILREGRRVVGLETGAGRVSCRVVVNAAGAWAAEVGRMAGVEVPVRPVRGQIVSTEALPEILGACLSTSACYLAQKRHGEVIVGSTTEEAGFDPGVTPAAVRSLCAGAVRAVPMLERVAVKRAWSGFRPGSPDELPILGPVEGLEGYLNACGHFRTGILNAPLTGLLLAELAAGEKPSHDLRPFLLSRFAREGVGRA